MNIYYIGGSPCSGKSTVAQILSEKYGLYYFKVDDYLDGYIDTCAKTGFQHCSQFCKLTSDQIWMRDPKVQCDAERSIYREIFHLLCSDLMGLPEGLDVIAEGAAFLPELMHARGIEKSRYLCITPTESFQISHYRKRPWIGEVLKHCSDPETAFDNWMLRDALFARCAESQCSLFDYVSLINDGSVPVDRISQYAANHFGLLPLP